MSGQGAPLYGLQHLAIIMDGNGRWAKARFLPRTAGHVAGVEAVRRSVRAAIELQIKYLTIYSFSSENWSRPADEVADLMGLLKRFIQSDLKTLDEQGVRVKIIGSRLNLPDDIKHLLQDAEKKTENNTKLTLIVAFNYGARQEILEAAQAFARNIAAGNAKPEDLSLSDFSALLSTRDIPDPDLILRTSGEERLSNFLLWQAAYAEFIFTPVLWPDFGKADLEAALKIFGQRQRRFGGI